MNIRRFLVMTTLMPKGKHTMLLTFSSPDNSIGNEAQRSINDCQNLWQRNLLHVIAEVAKYNIAEQNTCFVDTLATNESLVHDCNTRGETKTRKRAATTTSGAGLQLQQMALKQLIQNFEEEEFDFKNSRFKEAWQGSGKIGGIVQHLEMMYLVGNQVYQGLANAHILISDLLNWKNVAKATITYTLIICFFLLHLHKYFLTILLWALAINILSYRFKKKIKRIQIKTRHKNFIDYINMATAGYQQVSTATNIVTECNRLLLKLRSLLLGSSKLNSLRFVWFLILFAILTSIIPMSWLMVILIVVNFIAAYNVMGIWQQCGVWWDQVLNFYLLNHIFKIISFNVQRADKLMWLYVYKYICV